MSSVPFDVVGIGNAIVDLLAHASDAFLVNEGIHKGTMTLVDEARAGALLAKMNDPQRSSGGSAGNTVAGIAALGGRAAYIGKVHDDENGRVFANDLKKLGIHFSSVPAKAGASTACCMIFITPDGQRSMNTYLGACVDLGPNEIDETLIAKSRITYLEGYLFDKPEAKEAFYVAANFAQKHGRKVALTLSDPFCVNRHRADFVKLIGEKVDILFANESEACALFEKNTLDEVLTVLGNLCELAVVTRSEDGSVILHNGKVIPIKAAPVVKVEDTTGAGDLYAAGFLYGYTQGKELAECGRIASICAAEVISHVGPRPMKDLKGLI